MPLPVLTGAAPYPTQPIENAILIDALALASEAGSPKAANVVLIGAASVLFDFPIEKWFAAVEAHVKPKFLEANKKAFELGRSAAEKV
jgi:indolepyruvate ferredoxin oxidoreductase beta subunit